MVFNGTLAAELIASLPRRSRRAGRHDPERTTVIVPAHNEEMVIGSTVQSLMAAAGPHVEILVVADNCTDRTAEVSRNLGAQVAERADKDLRGKGYALAFARDWLRKSPPAAVIVLDADCRTDRKSLNAL